MTAEIIVRTSAQLESKGWTERKVLAAAKGEELRRLRPGIYVRTAEWNAHFIEGRQRAHARAALLALPAPPVFCHHTAAAIHRLPLYRVKGEDDRVHLVAVKSARDSTATVRHDVAVRPDEIEVIDGFLVTSLERTVFDLIRILPIESGVALTDAAMRQREDAALGGAEAFRAALLERIARSPGARGIRRARVVADFADRRADSPPESAARWFLHVLGFRDVQIQVAFPGPKGEDFRLDFRFRRGIGELDGLAKYTDPAFLSGRTAEQAVIDEKVREDWIRGRTQEPFVRWTDRDMPTAEALGAHLARFGIVPPG